MCNKFQLATLLLPLLAICLFLANAEAQQQQQQQQQQRLRLPLGYNMRLGSVPTRFVGKGAYTLAAKRGVSPSLKWQQQLQAQLPHQQQLLQQQQQQHKQLQQQQQQQQQQLPQRMQLYQWATMGGKKYKSNI
ncbi:hypothetical protein ACLKA6_009526 [Drosophila palustris]